ncbi:MAG: FAD-dependent oxidoreductase [Nostocoides sp.]
MTKFPTMLSPLQVGSVTLRNRVVSTAHGAFLDFYRPGNPGDQYIGYQERRAQGGTGLIVLQPIHVHRSSQSLGHYVYHPDDMRQKFRRMADAVHAQGAKVVVQVLHFGAQFNSDAHEDLGPLWSLNGMPSNEGEPSHAMTSAEIEEVVNGFVQTSVLAVEAGLDGVELHAAHGYLLQQSFSPWGNDRTDHWGEPLAFSRTVLDRVRAALGDEPVVGLRIAADDWLRPQAGGLGPEALSQVARSLVSTGHLDYLNHSEGSRASHYARAVGSYRHPYGEFLPLAADLRRSIDAAVPVIGVGRIVTADLAEQALVDGNCDLVGMTRAQIADPDLVNKLREGTTARVRPCVGANSGCVDRMTFGLGITCFHNPEVGREYRLPGMPVLPRTDRVRRVLVIGGGPAGMKAAEIAARRGHVVTLAERSAGLGGRLQAVAPLGPPSELLGAILWLQEELAHLNVEVLTNVDADDELVRSIAPEAVVLATGAVSTPQSLGPHDGSVAMLSTVDAATGQYAGTAVALQDEDVLAVDQLGTLEVALAAEALATAGARVTVATPGLHAFDKVGYTHLKDLMERLYGLGCTFEPSTLFVKVADGAIHTRHVYTREVRKRAFAAVVAGIPGRPDLSLSASIPKHTPVHLAGDVVAPRSALHAFREGYDAGRAV